MVTETGLRAATDQASGEVYITLIAFTSPDLGAPLRFALNDETILSNSNNYLPSGFQFKPPAIGGDRISAGTLRIDNIDRSITDAIHQLTASPDIAIMEILASAPDTIQSSLPAFKFFNISWNKDTVEGSIGINDDQDEPSVSLSFTPKHAPALYA